MIKIVAFDIFGVFYKPSFLLLGSYDKEMIQIVEELKKKNIRVIAITNSTQNFSGLTNVFQKRYVGSELGMYKPEKNMFAHVLTEEKVAPGEVLFFDDGAENVGVAKEMGINAFLFESPEETKKILERFF